MSIHTDSLFSSAQTRLEENSKTSGEPAGGYSLKISIEDAYEEAEIFLDSVGMDICTKEPPQGIGLKLLPASKQHNDQHINYFPSQMLTKIFQGHTVLLYN